ncbi:hypothetical protein UO65_6025 [Actinokineospora spheciospongiae]|uniref:Uncharacterized protein n=1 Tax=Actinokineospora spheciospongiae TaxID=909613 RepID=W7IQ83_9PSEU|nr:hypothetical protein [Actinokineospora spheciospongiae]EWC58671.1 hypothetical protein UO65_6025 [Actinokineospora spheciospongiae]
MVRRTAAVVLASALVVAGAQDAAAVSGPGDAGVPFWVDVSHLRLVSDSGIAVGTYQGTISLFRGGSRVSLGSTADVQVNDINATGTSAGRVSYRAATWSPTGAITTIPNLPDATTTEAVDINDSGDVLVTTFQGRPFSNGAAIWHAGALTPLRYGDTPVQAVAMNGGAQVIAVTDSGDFEAPREALRCTLAGTCTALPMPTGAELVAVHAINDAGTVVGTIIVEGVTRAVAWDANGQVTVLPPLPGHAWTNVATIRHAVNTRGDIVGYSDATAVVWRAGVPTALPGGRTLSITDQNDRGDVVGSAQNAAGDPRPFVISRGSSFSELGTLMLLPRGEVKAISAGGLAVGTSWFSVSFFPGAGISNLRATTWQVG